MFKKIVLPILFIMYCFGNNTIAQVTPDGILFQAVARDINGNAAAGRNIYAKVSILKGTATGSSVYAESFKVVSTDDGIFTLVIGKGVRTSGVQGLTSIVWNDALYFVNIKIAIEPSLPTPGWSPDTEYQDMGTSQLWSVPYALFATKSSVADSALSISTVVPGSKGGTGVNNDGKTITLGQNLTFKGIGDITITTTGASNVSLPLTGLLANTQYVSDRIAADTISLSKRIDALGVSAGTSTALKVNISDTASMLSPYLRKLDTTVMLNPYLRKVDTASLSRRIDIKLDSAQIPGIIAPYLVTVAGVKYADTASMLTPYRLSMIDKDNYKISNNAVVASLVADTATLITRFGYKINASDTATMLSKYYNKTAADARFNLKVNISDTSAMLLPYAIRSNTEASMNTKVNIADTASMLTSYYNKTATDARLNLKSNISDTASMLSSYYNKTAADARLNLKVNISDTALMLSNRFARDTASLSNRINALSTSAGGDLAAEIARATAAENLKLNKSDTAAMLSPYRLSMIDKDLYKISNNLVVGNLFSKISADSLTLATKIKNDSTTQVNRLVTDSTILKGFINTNATNISNNAIAIGQNATNIAANTLAISNRVSFSDMPNYLAPYLKAVDTTSMLSNYRFAMIDNNAKVAALIDDTATLITRFSYKENLSNKSTDVVADATSNVKYPSVKAVKDFVDAAITTATPDATTSKKGKIQLAGDLGGIAAAPTVNSVGGSSSTTIHTAELLANGSTDLNTSNALVKRDLNGDFSARTITANLLGNATNVTGIVAAANGGTGVDNIGKTITLGGNINTAGELTTLGSFPTTLTTTGVTALTLPTTGTIATLAGTETLTNKTIVDAALTGIPTAPTAAAGNNSTQLATTAFVNLATAAATPDATTLVKGKVQLTNDLGGTADLPTVNSVGGSSSSTIHTAELLANAATNLNTNNTIVKRDLNGDFNARNITANLVGTATNVTGVVAGTNGGTGVSNAGKTITLGGNINTSGELTTIGNFPTTITTSGATSITLPTSGTIATLAGTETLTNKIIVDAALTGLPTAPTAVAGTNNTQVATTAFVSSAAPDATNLTKGKIQLNGDLGGTASAPTVNSVGGSSSSTIHTAEVLANAATNLNTSDAIVKRDNNGDFSAGTITANLLGNATNVTGIVLGANGGTGIDNSGKTITLGGNISTGKDFITTGTNGTNASNITLKTTNNTTLTLPTTGTLVTLDGTETLTNKTLNGLTLTKAVTGFTIAGGNTSKLLTVSNDATISGTNTGDQMISLTGDITGAGSGTFSTTLANSGVTLGTYGGATTVPTITIDSKGRITSASNTAITGVSSIGSLLESGKIIVGSSINQASKVDMTGDVTINNMGVTAIGVDKITTAKILNAAVTYDKIQETSTSDVLLGRVSAGAGKIEEIATIGTGNVVRANSPTFTGTPLVPTAIYPSNDKTIASTEYVTTAISNISASSVSGILPGTNGGTGVNNGTKKITLGGDLTTASNNAGNYNLTLTLNGSSNLTLPTSGTLATLSDVQGSSIGGNQITGVINPINGGTGVANDNSKSITLGGSINTGGNLITTGTTGSNASNITFKTTASTDLILPTTGTIATLSGTETLTSKTIDATNNTISNIRNSNIAATAGIVDSKLATISTTGKVANSATTATDANTASAIVSRDANGSFSANTITAALNGNANTATKLGASKNIYGNAFDGSVDLAQIITSTYGGTGNGFTKFSGAANTEKTYTLPDASATILTTNDLVTVGQGGTGAATANQNFVFAGPASGASAGAPSFRALVAADLPAGSGSYIANTTTQQLNSNFNIDGAGVVGGNMTAGSFVISNNIGSKFLKSDGTLDATSYATAGANSNITSLTGLTTALSLTQGGTGSTTKNFVDLTTTQSISGTKSFNSDLTVNGLTIGLGTYSNTTNTAFGKSTLASVNNINATDNTAIGYQALKSNTGSAHNTAIGSGALTSNTNGIQNTAIGSGALKNNVSGYNNVAIGKDALISNITGYGLTTIGWGTNIGADGLSNATAIGFLASATASNTVQLGNSDVTNVRTSGSITAGAVTYPKTDGLSGQVLVTDGAGNAAFRTIDGAGAILTNGKILVGNASNVATPVTVSGDISMTNLGVASIASGVVGYTKLQNVSASNRLLGRTTTGAGVVEEIPMSGAGNVNRAIMATNYDNITLSDNYSGYLIYSEHGASPSFPETLSDGFNCTIVNFGGAAYTSNTLTSARFYTNNTGNAGSTNFTIPLGGTVNIFAIKINGGQRYYVNYGDAPAIAGTGLTNNAGTFNVNTAQNISSLSNLSTNGIVTTSGSNGTLSVVGSVPVTQGGTGLTSLTTGDLLYASAANTINKLGIGTNGQVLTSNGTTIAWSPNTSASLAGGVAGAIPYQSGVGVTSYTSAGLAGQILTSAGTSTPTWTTIIPVANGGTGASTLASNAVILGNGTSALQTVVPGASGNILTSNGTTWTSAPLVTTGVNTLGAISATSNAKGATISGTTLTLTPADATNGGIVTNGAQTFAGTKTFADMTISGALNGASTAGSTIAGFNAAITSVTGALTISAANAATYNGKVLVCSGSSFVITFDSTVPVGFSCMVLQSDNNTVNFTGTNNRYNYTATSGIYAIATAMCYASGAVLLTGDLQ